MRKILVVVDMQQDFTTGALGFPEAEQLIEPITTLVERWVDIGGEVIFTRDKHFDDYLETREGTHLPIAHCLHNSVGAETAIHPNLTVAQRLDHINIIVKHTFGAARLFKEYDYCEDEDIHIAICGVVTNLCVLSNAIILQSIFPNAYIQILSHLCAAPNRADHERALQTMRDLHMEII